MAAGDKAPVLLDFPPHTPTEETRELVSQLVACSIDEESICFVIKANPFELRTHYAHELKFGHAACVAQMQSAVFRAGLAGDMKAATFWLRTQAGWREVTRVEDNSTVKRVDADRQKLIDRIVGMLTPEQAVSVLKAEQPGPVAESVPQPLPGTRLN